MCTRTAQIELIGLKIITKRVRTGPLVKGKCVLLLPQHAAQICASFQDGQRVHAELYSDARHAFFMLQTGEGRLRRRKGRQLSL